MSHYNFNNHGQNQGYYQSQETYFDPYADAANRQHEPHASYDQGGYHDDYQQDSARPAPVSNYASREMDQPFSAEKLNAPLRDSPNLKRMRYEREGLWTRGGGLRVCGRYLCCTLLVGVWMALGIILALALYLRPPNVLIGEAQLPQSNQLQSLPGGGIQINVIIPISVNNPSYIDIGLPDINAKIYYPINNTQIGNGSLSDTTLPSGSNKTFDFPFALQYTADKDPSQEIITDILKKCLGNEDLTVRYDLTVDVKVLSVNVKPSISNNVSFSCPIDSSTLSSIGGGLNLTSIISGLTG